MQVKRRRRGYEVEQRKKMGGMELAREPRCVQGRMRNRKGTIMKI